LDAVEISDVAGRRVHHKRHQVARLSLFAFQSVWRVGNATTLYLLHHVSGNHLEQILLDGRHVMWLGIQNRERPDRKTIGPAQRNASIKPQATLLQPWVVSEARVSCQVADAAAIPPNPNSAAISAMIRKVTAQPNIVSPLVTNESHQSIAMAVKSPRISAGLCRY